MTEPWIINKDLNLLFIHIAKNAGTSFKTMFGISVEQTTHSLPFDLCTKEEWEKYFSVMIVRHPFDRLLSSYFYHTGARYTQGAYMRRFPDIKGWSLPKYFQTLTNIEENYANAIMPQTLYLKRHDSFKVVDFIIKYETFRKDVKRLMELLGVEREILHLNSSERDLNKINITDEFIKEIMEFYKFDCLWFGYDSDVNYVRKRYLNQ